MAAEVVDGFVGETFETVVFGTLGLLVAAAVIFGLLNVVDRDVVVVADVADLTRDVVDDDTVDVVAFDEVVVVVSFDATVVLVAGFVTVLEYIESQDLRIVSCFRMSINFELHDASYLALSGTRGAAVEDVFGAKVFVAKNKCCHVIFILIEPSIDANELTGCGCASGTSWFCCCGCG